MGLMNEVATKGAVLGPIPSYPDYKDQAVRSYRLRVRPDTSRSCLRYDPLDHDEDRPSSPIHSY
jgi:hypothetical protein